MRVVLGFGDGFGARIGDVTVLTTQPHTSVNRQYTGNIDTQARAGADLSKFFNGCTWTHTATF